MAAAFLTRTECLTGIWSILFAQTRVVGWEYRPYPLGSKEIDGLLVPPGKAYLLLTDHLITG